MSNNETAFLEELNSAICILGDMNGVMKTALEGVALLSRDEKVHEIVRNALVFVRQRADDLDEVRKRGVALCVASRAGGG